MKKSKTPVPVTKALPEITDVPLCAEADALLRRITPRINERLKEVTTVPVSILLWGPGISSDSPLTQVRAKLKSKLRELGHAAIYSEDLYDPSLPYSVRMQQLAQAQEFDLIISTPCTPGSIAEIHDFAADRRVTAKLLIFLNSEHVEGYSPKSLEAIQGLIACHLAYYPGEHNTGVIEEITYNNVQRIREMKYILAGRF